MNKSRMRLITATGILLLALNGSTSEPLSKVNSKALQYVPPEAKSLTLQDVRADSSLGSVILKNARRLDGDDDNAGGAVDFSFVSGYSIKFQGCHHISQWNENVDEDGDDVRIYTKRLVRFRLCPIGSCSDVKSAGCTSKYGDYIVDMNTFVYYYLTAIEDDLAAQCDEAESSCYSSCGGNDDDCMFNCYANVGMASCYKSSNDQDDDQADDSSSGDSFSALTYAQCAQWSASDDDGGSDYYIGPYCAEQGGEVHLGLFSDDACTMFASNSKSTFYSLAGFELPYSSQSLIPTSCMSCLDQSDYYDDYSGDDSVKEICSNIYSASGKCETKMSVDYPNESACTYIEGVKIIREDGVIRTSTKRKSKAAAVCIGVFTTVAVLLGAYVYYLRTKLGRAKINLSPPNSSLL